METQILKVFLGVKQDQDTSSVQEVHAVGHLKLSKNFILCIYQEINMLHKPEKAYVSKQSLKKTTILKKNDHSLNFHYLSIHSTIFFHIK